MAVATMKDCVEALAQKRGISKAEAQSIMTDAVDVIADACVNNGGVAFIGKFTIKTATRKGRSGNLNGHEYDSPDKTVLKISAGKQLEEALNK